eukprot:6617378-Heterocapsa_arctica.AAC.1
MTLAQQLQELTQPGPSLIKELQEWQEEPIIIPMPPVGAPPEVGPQRLLPPLPASHEPPLPQQLPGGN